MPTIDFDSCFKSFTQEWLKDRTIYLTLHGSHAYGMNTEHSDVDLRGIAVPTIDHYIGVNNNFEQAQSDDPYDLVVFDIRKFAKLSLDCNPNAIELLFTEEKDHVYTTKHIRKLFDIRESFLSKKAAYTFAGYAHAQIKRIQRHRRWLLNPVEKQPTRSDFGLPEHDRLIPKYKLEAINAEIQKVLDQWMIDTSELERDLRIKLKNQFEDILSDMKINSDELHMYAARKIGLNDNLIEFFQKERQYDVALKEWRNYQKWKKERNKERYELEKKFHMDTKHCSQLVRLYRSCVELLRDCKLNVKRPDAKELLAIKNGAWTYDQVLEYSEKQDEIIRELYETSKLPRIPNMNLVNDTIMEIIMEMYSDTGK